eukprot:gene23109-27962_t
MARRGAVGESAAALVGALAALEGFESGAHPGERLALMAVEREPCLLLSNARDVRGAASALAELAGDKAEALRAVAQFPSLLLAKPHAFNAATLDAIGALVGGRTAALEFLGRHSELLRCQKGVLARGAVKLGKALGEVASEVAAARPAVLTLAPGAAMTVMKALEKALGGAELARQAVRENPALLEESSPKLLEAEPKTLGEVVFELLMGLTEHWDLDSDDSDTGAAVRQEQPKKARGLWKKALSRLGAAECVAPVLQEVEDRMCRLQ